MGLERIDYDYGLVVVVGPHKRTVEVPAHRRDKGTMRVETGLRAAVFSLYGPPHGRILSATWMPESEGREVAEVRVDLPAREPDSWAAFADGARACPDFSSAIEGVESGLTWLNESQAFAEWALAQARLIVPRRQRSFSVMVPMFVEAETPEAAVTAAADVLGDGGWERRTFIVDDMDDPADEPSSFHLEQGQVLPGVSPDDEVASDEEVRRG